MKGDYSQPGLLPGQCLEQIDLPSAYLVYAVGRRLRRQVQHLPGSGPIRTGLLSTRFLHDLAEIMVLIELNHYQSTTLDGLDSTSRLRIRRRATAAFQKP
jgi:hypothetical protein